MDLAFLEWLQTARIDIKNLGDGNNVKVKVIEGKNFHIKQARWFSKGGAGYVMETAEQHMVLELEFQGAGNLFLRLRGIDKRTEGGNRLPLWVDYTRLAINDEVIFWEMKPLWHDKPYVFRRKTYDGEKLKVEISWSQHGYRGDELAELFALLNAPVSQSPELPIPPTNVSQRAVDDASYVPDILWAQVYHDTIIGSKWLLDKAISPGGKRGWAVGYNFLYVLYRVLNEMKPRCILELGLGQSTKLTSQYAAFAGAKHTVVEHDEEWEDFFRGSFPLSPATHVVQRNLIEQEYDGVRYFAYEDFVGAVQPMYDSCDLILVDGPFGYSKERSRRDIVPHLTRLLSDEFVIMVDDCGRAGEANLLEEIKGILDGEGREFASGLYKGSGNCHVGVVVCKKWRFLVSL